MGSIARKIFYALPPGWRFFARWIVYLPQDILMSVFSPSDQPVPPRRLIFTGAGDFIRMGDMFLRDFQEKELIRTDSRVLDIGSGIGRIALPLTQFLTSGSYEGFDIMKPGIEWCKKNISARFPNFHFTQVALSNDLYRQAGASAARFTFPYPDNHFDLAIATSVFTHMLPEEVSHYVAEMYRVLKKGGFAYLTFFILNENSIRQMQEKENPFHFKYDYGTYRLLDEKVKSANVAYDENFLFEKIIPPTQFTTTAITYGTWSTQQQGSPIAFQDLVVIEKT